MFLNQSRRDIESSHTGAVEKKASGMRRWAAVEEAKLNYHDEETLLFDTYTYSVYLYIQIHICILMV